MYEKRHRPVVLNLGWVASQTCSMMTPDGPSPQQMNTQIDTLMWAVGFRKLHIHCPWIQSPGSLEEAIGVKVEL